jgi:predicted AlkP superfamily phosphohydrolase/phosphomutase
MKSERSTPSGKQKVFLIGIDGGTFDIIKPMIAEGRLTTLSGIISNGSHGALLSTIPPLSPVAWTTLSTGMNPGKHNILDFLKKKPNSYEVEIMNASFRRARPIWNLLNRAGKMVGVINVPVTYPPDHVHGIMISGMDTPNQSGDFMIPDTLAQELENAIGGYKLENIKFRSMGENPEKQVNALFSILENRYQTARYVLDNYPIDFMFMVFDTTDRAQHNFWKYNDHGTIKTGPSEKCRGLIQESYDRVDRKIGDLVEKLGPEDMVIIASDHGFTSIRSGVRLNLWLSRNSYLTFRRKMPLHRRAVKKINSVARTRVKNILSEGLIKKIRGGGSRKEQINVLPSVDMKKTKAFCISSYGIYLNLKGREPDGIVEPGDEYEKLREKIMSDLLQLRDPSTGEQVIDEVLKKEDVVHGQYTDSAPDIYITWRSGYFFMGERQQTLFNIKSTGDDIFTAHNWSGQHARNGIFIIKGPHIKKNHQIENANIADIAPTIMYLMGLDIPEQMDGKVLLEVIEEEYLKQVPVRRLVDSGENSLSQEPPHGFSKVEADSVMDRLRDLGYMD